MEERTGLLREGPAGLKLVNEGIEIDAASLGKLVLECPRLFDQEQKVESKLTARWSLGWRRGMKVRLRNSMRGGMTAGGFDELLGVGLPLSTEGAWQPTAAGDYSTRVDLPRDGKACECDVVQRLPLWSGQEFFEAGA
jgi:hypothetical protein